MSNKLSLFILFIVLILSNNSCDSKKESTSVASGSKTSTEDTIAAPVEADEVFEETEEETDPTIIDTTIWNHYASIKIGDADYKGRYSYEYSIYTNKNGTLKRINNSELFNDKKEELEKLINEKIKKEYEFGKKDPGAEGCFDDVEYQTYTLDELGIEFGKKNHIIFNGNFGLSDACFSMDAFSIKLPVENAAEYIKE